MKSINLILLVLILLFQGCKNDCAELCFTPAQAFLFELVDKTSGENVFTNGSYTSRDIAIRNVLNNNSPVEFTFISENDINLIQIGSIGWKTEIVNLKIDLADSHIFNFYVDAERSTGDCCSHTEYKEIAVTGSEFELDSQTGIYKILVE